MKRSILFIVALTIFIVYTKAQSSKFSIGVFSDIMPESPVYPVYYGVQGSYDLKKHAMLQVFLGYSNVYMKTLGANYLYYIKQHSTSGFNIYAGAGISGDFYKQKITVYGPDHIISIDARDSYLSLNPTVGASYRITSMRSVVNIGYKIKYYPVEDTADINFLSLGLRYYL